MSSPERSVTLAEMIFQKLGASAPGEARCGYPVRDFLYADAASSSAASSCVRETPPSLVSSLSNQSPLLRKLTAPSMSTSPSSPPAAPGSDSPAGGAWAA
eukprot:380378-Pyramimonas_sp.AAC.1